MGNLLTAGEWGIIFSFENYLSHPDNLLFLNNHLGGMFLTPVTTDPKAVTFVILAH
jgi:hypothetical protein